jgi:amino acid permease
VNNEPYSNVGKATLIALIVIFIVSIVLILIASRKKELSNVQVFGVMVFEYFIMHTLGFYVYWAFSLDFRTDGQLIFGAVTSFPISSFGFIGLGLLLDVVKKRPPK